MALKQGKKTVNLNTENLGLAPMPTTSITAQIAKPISDIINTFQKTAEADAKVNWQFQFDQSTRDHYLNLKEKHRSDPEGMRNAVDTYSKTVLANTPNAFKPIAQNVLAGKNLANMNFASTNARNEDTRNALNGWEIKKVQFEEDLNTNLFEINQNVDASPIDFNNHIDEQLLTLNQNYGLGQESLVETGRIAQSQLTTDLDKDIKNIEILRVFNIMKNIDEVDAIKYLTQYANGVDKFALQSKNKENPIYKKYNNYLKDPFERSENVNKIKKLYQQHTTENIFGKPKNSNKINTKQLYEPNNLMSWEQFQGADKDGHDLAMSIPNMEYGSAKYNQIIEDANYRNNIQSKISKFQQGGKLIDFKSEQEKSDVASAILANFGIHDIQMGMVNGEFTESFITATNLLSELNVFPDEFKNYLKIDGGGSYDKPEVLAQLKEKILAYNYLTSNELFPNWGGADPFLKWAAEQGIESRNDIAAAETLNKYKDINWDTRYNNIKGSFNDGIDEDGFLWFDINRFNNSLGTATFSPNAFLKLFMDHENPYHKHLLAEGDQTTWMSWRGERIIPAHARMQLKELFINEMTLMSNSDDFDVWAKENAPLRTKAWHRTMQRLKDENWGIETHTSDGVPKLVKQPFWLNKGSFNNDDVYAAMNKDFHSLDKNGQMEKYGSNNWEKVIDKYFKEYADNPNGNVKIALDNDGTNNYDLTIHKGEDAITLDEKFHPHNWMSIDKDAPASATQVHNHVADLMYKEFQKTDLYKNLDKSKSEYAEKAIYGFARTAVGMGNWRWYPDMPIFTGVPWEIRPLAFMAKAVGFDGDLREMRTTFETMATIKNESLSFVKKINANRKIKDTESAVEALYPPHKMPYTKNNMDLHYKAWVTENYQDKSKALTHRTNNWGAVSSDNWNGEMDIKLNADSRKFAVFSHPKDSIRASVKTILNHSTLTAALNKVDTRYGSNPTIEKILTMYAKDSGSYLKSLEQNTNFMPEDTIDLMDSNQMHKLLKFIVKHEMGHEYYDNNFGTSNSYVDNVIIQGYKEAIYSYNGELGKL